MKYLLTEHKKIFRSIFYFLFLFSNFSSAEPFPQNSNFEAGDEITYLVSLNERLIQLQYIIKKIDSGSIEGITLYNGKENIFKGKDFNYEDKVVLLTSGQLATRIPAIKLYDEKIDIGMSWNNSYEILAETFIANISEQVHVGKYEKIQIDDIEINCKTILITSNIDGLGDLSSFKGTSTSKIWVGVFEKRLLILQREYQNTLGSKMTQKLLKVSRSN